MNYSTLLKLCLCLLASVVAFAKQVTAQVTVKQTSTTVTMENERLRVAVSLQGGGRLTEFVNKTTGKNWIGMWKGPAEFGGALDDRLVFTMQPYSSALVQPGGQSGVMRLTATNANGLSIIKTLTLRGNEPVLRISYELSNGTQLAVPFVVRNVLAPGGSPITEDHKYYLPLRDKPIVGQPWIANFFTGLAEPWAALIDSRSHEGLLAVVPGVDKFYFWQRSREHPTFEWVYAHVPAGKTASATLALVMTNEATPNWSQRAGEVMPSLQPTRLTDIAGWQDEATRFGVTDAERKRGFWLSTGQQGKKERLPATLEIDLPLNEERAAYFSLNTLHDFGNEQLSVALSGLPPELVKIGHEVSGPNFLRVETPASTSTASADAAISFPLSAGTESKVWLMVQAGQAASEYRGTLTLKLGQEQVEVPLRVKVWPVRVPEQRPFEVRGYGTLPVYTQGYDVTPQSIVRLDALYSVYKGMGGNVIDWSLSWPDALPKIKVDGGDAVLTWAKNYKGALPAELPHLDFSYFDPWIAVAKKHGVTRVDTYNPFLNDDRLQALLNVLAGKGRVQAGTPEAIRLNEWLLRELRAYFAGHGFRGFFCKLGDEIPPDSIPAYKRTAEVVRRAGWRPFTTVTGLVARTAEYINAMDPDCDQWQLSFGLRDDFYKLTRNRYRVAHKSVVLNGNWQPYRNGGAKNTWSLPVFGSLVPENPDGIETLKVVQGGQELTSRRSPWGNTKGGVYSWREKLLFVAPQDGKVPANGSIKLDYTTRIADANGQSLTAIDTTDEIWMYGGSRDPYRTPYEGSAIYPLIAALENLDGYGWWAFQHNQPSARIAWYGEDGTVSTGPTYLGLRDGWNDARLIEWVRAEEKLPAETFSTASDNALYRFENRTNEAYRFRTISNMNSPVALNLARRKMLEAMAK